MNKSLLEARKEVSRQEIISAATELFATKGVRATSMSQLADALGVTKPALYHWFESKREIVIETVQSNIVAFTSAVLGSVPGDLDAPATIRASVEAKLQQIEVDGAQPLRFFYTVMLEELDEPEVEDVYRDFWSTGRAAARHWIEQGRDEGAFDPDLDVEAVANVMTATFMGVDLLWLNDPDHVDPRATYGAALEQIMTTLTGSPGTAPDRHRSS